MRNFAKFFVAFLVGVSLFYFVIKETGVEVVWEATLLFFGLEGLLILFTTLIIVLIGSVRWRCILKSMGEDVPFSRVFRYLIKGFTVDFLTPFSLFGGEMVRVFLMEKEVGIKKSASSSLIDKIMDVTAHFSFLLFGTFLFIYYSSAIHSALLFYAGTVIALIFFILFLFYKKILQKQSFLKWIFGLLGISKKPLLVTENGKTIMEIEEQIIEFFSVRKKDFAKGMALSFLRHLFFITRIFLIIFFITGRAEAGLSIAVYGLVILAMILPLPAALGGMEAILGLGFGVLSIGAFSGVTTAIALRGADLAVCLVGITLFVRLSFSSFYNQFNLFVKRFSE
jgi:glycosyltransferase 2 family protein